MRFILAGILLAAIATSAREAPRIDVWPVDSLVKVFPNDQPATTEPAPTRYDVPRSGHAVIQLAARSAEAVPALSVAVKIRVHGLEFRVRRTGCVPVESNTKDTPPEELIRAAPGLFPDPLFEHFPFALAPNRTTSISPERPEPASAGALRTRPVLRLSTFAPICVT